MWLVTRETPEGDNVEPQVVASTFDAAKSWIEEQESEPLTWDWNPADDTEDIGFVSIDGSSGDGYRVTEVPSI